MKEPLTLLKAGAILSPLAVGKLHGIATPFKIGQKMTATLAVFFRASFHSMAGLFGHTSVWPLLFAVVATHSNPPPKSLQPLGGGLSTLNRIHCMTTLSVRAKPAPKLTPVFNLTLHRRMIASDISLPVAVRFKRFYPDAKIKFAGFGGAL